MEDVFCRMYFHLELSWCYRYGKFGPIQWMEIDGFWGVPGKEICQGLQPLVAQCYPQSRVVTRDRRLFFLCWRNIG